MLARLAGAGSPTILNWWQDTPRAHYQARRPLPAKLVRPGRSFRNADGRSRNRFAITLGGSPSAPARLPPSLCRARRQECAGRLGVVGEGARVRLEQSNRRTIEQTGDTTGTAHRAKQVRPALAEPEIGPSGNRFPMSEARARGLHTGPSALTLIRGRLERRSLSIFARCNQSGADIDNRSRPTRACIGRRQKCV